jgi:hypothetical protein
MKVDVHEASSRTVVLRGGGTCIYFRRDQPTTGRATLSRCPARRPGADRAVILK